MSDDESNISEFGDVYLSDEYKPKSDEETSSDNDILVERAKRRTTSIKDLGDNAAGPYTAEHNISVDAEDTVIIKTSLFSSMHVFPEQISK
ncbi:unnamed protein product [Acanthoscelides obtectus]|uniref:Uncharacterized protein n=1 Tax=Acanthoscelides obtectus TaxID=200917 RepID=A0A9P0PEK1_ACAOB|nr:unnamed protein product [Acanthoscelides obtectus]CAK1645616.1 hypothetical protein AOBTE_LOCUS14173 [Acanthoscelides obtectus]